ncbi:endonuclease [Echinicola strongylocentroti]|uniref:Endonuclease n=1 Tax=Echinicola strongylocentroti TaxID=1795355 RepID=A0A2Z4IHG4_9BACT|nr:endonuclease/exonuclease/phosphatase family protein [Echinicola strongylocentroti]AWW29996.1 endonuclease [Echinicola strongylocentroti]
MKRTALSFLLALVSTAMLQAQETTFTLMTYNIYHGEKAYEEGAQNLQEIAQLIKEIKPDFVALQEVDSMTQRTAAIYNNQPVNLVQELAEQTGMHGFFAKAIEYSNGGYGEGLLSRQPAKMTKVDLPIPEGGEGRAMALASYQLESGKQITFGATHLCHQYDANRIAQTKAIVAHMDKIPGATIVAGDLNFSPDSNPYPIIEKDFIDAAATYGNPKPTIPYDNPKSRIDYVWLSKNAHWEITEVKVLPVDFSDHMPVVVTVRIKE